MVEFQYMNLGRHNLACSLRCGLHWRTLNTDCTKIRIKVGYELSVQITLTDKLNKKSMLVVEK